MVLVTWYGTSSFRIETDGRVLLIDPYLSRGEGARPKLPFGPEGVTEASEIFVSHGHFDHAADVPRIARQTDARVYCSEAVAAALRRQGVPDEPIVEVHGGEAFDFGVYRVQCFCSAHVRFDLGLVARTLFRALPSMPSLMRRLSRLRQWPPGQVLACGLRMCVGKLVEMPHGMLKFVPDADAVVRLLRALPFRQP